MTKERSKFKIVIWVAVPVLLAVGFYIFYSFLHPLYAYSFTNLIQKTTFRTLKLNSSDELLVSRYKINIENFSFSPIPLPANTCSLEKDSSKVIRLYTAQERYDTCMRNYSIQEGETQSFDQVLISFTVKNNSSRMLPISTTSFGLLGMSGEDYGKQQYNLVQDVGSSDLPPGETRTCSLRGKITKNESKIYFKVSIPNYPEQLMIIERK